MPPPGRLTTVDGAGPSSLSAGDPGGMAGAVQALLNRDRAMSLTVGSGAPPPPVERRDSLQANVNAPHLSKYVIPPLTVVNRDADAPSDDDDDESPIDRSRSNSSSTLHPVISGNPIVRRSPSPAAASPSSSPQVQHTPPSGLYRPASNPSMDKSLSSMSSGGGHLISVPNSALQPYTTYQHPQHIHQQQSQTQQQSNHSSQQQPTQSLPIQHQNILPVLSPVDTPFSSNPNSAAPVYQPQQQQKQNQQSTPTLPSMHDRPPVPPKNNS
ncbi:hypothetical protein DFS34DRAFT_194343 [Phlyctochytrium arcticum]|nr:hypothetical protein DFS34DRAFT_194343 [Phlyctochytrium arcticum]